MLPGCGAWPGIVRQALGPSARRRHAGHQPARVGVGRVAEQRLDRGGLDNASGIHDRDAVDELGDDAEVVRDEQHRHVQPVAKLAQQAEDLELHGDVERGGRFVGDEHLRPAGERDGDHHPLAHPARQLMRIGAHLQRRIGNADHLKKLARALAGGGAGEAVVDAHRFGDLLADPDHRIERGHRLLEDHRDIAVAGLDPLPRRQIR